MVPTGQFPVVLGSLFAHHPDVGDDFHHSSGVHHTSSLAEVVAAGRYGLSAMARLKDMDAKPAPRLQGRKQLKSFAHGIAHKYSCSAEHYAWMAYTLRLPRVTVDIYSLRIEPPEFDIERNRILAKMLRSGLLRNLKSLKPPGSVMAAVLIAEFGINEYFPDGQSGFIGESSYTVILTDDRGKEWRAVVRNEKTLIVG